MRVKSSLLAIVLVATLLVAACGGGSTAVQEDAGAPPDEEAPVVTLDLGRYDVVAGARSVTMWATDNVAVARTELLVDGVAVAESTAEPFTIAWDTTAAADGVRAVQVAVYDTADNRGESETVPIFVVNTGEVVEFDETPGLGTAFLEAEFKVPADWTTQDIDLKWHWTMPAGMNRVVGVLLFDATVGFELAYSVGTGWCPHSGVKLLELTESDGEILLEYAPGTALPEVAWFTHLGSPNAGDLLGQATPVKVRLILLP